MPIENTRHGKYRLLRESGELVSQHNYLEEVFEAASEQAPGTYRVDPPSTTVVVTADAVETPVPPIEPPDPPVDPVDPPEGLVWGQDNSPIAAMVRPVRGAPKADPLPVWPKTEGREL